jgi:hypothetical protein
VKKRRWLIISTWKAPSPLITSLLNKVGIEKKVNQEYYCVQIRVAANSNKLTEKKKKEKNNVMDANA